jgi:Flp pilus assembly protein TadG
MRQPNPRQEAGNTAVEFALLLPVLVLLIAGLVDFGRAYFTKMELENAARAGGQYGILHGAGDLDTIKSIVRDATDIPSADLTVNAATFCACPDGTVQACAGGDCGGFKPGSYISITAQTAFVPIFPFANSARPVTIAGAAQVRME